MTAAMTGVELTSELAVQMRREMYSHPPLVQWGVTIACTYSLPWQPAVSAAKSSWHVNPLDFAVTACTAPRMTCISVMTPIVLCRFKQVSLVIGVSNAIALCLCWNSLLLTIAVYVLYHACI